MRTMNESLAQLSAVKQQELKTIVEVISQTMPKSSPAEMIILFGSYARGEGVEDRYQEGHITYEYQSDFDLLVLVRFKNLQRQSKLERVLRQAIEASGVKTPVSVIVHDVEFVNQALADSQYFFTDIYREGILLYDSKQYQLGVPVPLPPAKRLQLAKEDFKYWFEKAEDAFVAYKYLFKVGKSSESMFNLHQTSERLLHTVMLVYTHYKPKCHDLEKLRGLICGLDEQFKESLPLTSDEDKRLFQLLCEAYIDARYKRDYVIVLDDLTAIAERVQAFRDSVERQCQGKIQDFEAEAKLSE